MQGKVKERWLELCERAANENDIVKFLMISREIDDLLSEKQQRLTSLPTRLWPTCWLCGKAVSLETCKSDEHGRAVHEECYVADISRS